MLEKIAYVDDSHHNLEIISLMLQADYVVESFDDPLQFLTGYPKDRYATILVDIHMPLMDGFTLYQKIIENQAYNGCPIIFISSDDTDENRIRSFTLGAVDFLNRQVAAPELISRIKSKVSFFQKHRNIIEFGRLKLDLTLLKATLDNEELKLTFIEFKLLYHFLKCFPAITTKDELVDKVWSNDFVLDATIYTHIFNLNAKIDNWDYEIVTERNRGVLLVKK